MQTENAIATKQVSGNTGRKRTTNLKTRTVSAIVAIVFALALVIPAHAQIDPGGFIIRQNGVQVGVIYVPQHEPGAGNYVEHWVLYDNYTYPGRDASLVTTITAATKDEYRDEADFFARVPWGKGFRYVRVDSTDTDRLPGR